MGVKMNHFVHFFRFFILCSGKVIEGVKMNYFVNFVLPLMAKSSINQIGVKCKYQTAG